MTGSLQVKNDNYYAVLNFKDNNGIGKKAQETQLLAALPVLPFLESISISFLSFYVK